MPEPDDPTPVDQRAEPTDAADTELEALEHDLDAVDAALEALDADDLDAAESLVASLADEAPHREPSDEASAGPTTPGG